MMKSRVLIYEEKSRRSGNRLEIVVTLCVVLLVDVFCIVCSFSFIFIVELYFIVVTLGVPTIYLMLQLVQIVWLLFVDKHRLIIAFFGGLLVSSWLASAVGDGLKELRACELSF